MKEMLSELEGRHLEPVTAPLLRGETVQAGQGGEAPGPGEPAEWTVRTESLRRPGGFESASQSPGEGREEPGDPQGVPSDTQQSAEERMHMSNFLGP